MKSIITRIFLTIAVALFFLAIAFLSSCSAIMAPIVEAVADEIFIDYPYLAEPLDDVWSRSSAFDLQKEPEGETYWKSPIEMEHDCRGDCEDFAGWMIYHLGDEARCVMVRRPEDVTDHTIVEYRGQYIEPQTYGKTYSADEFRYIGSMSYDAAMKMATALYTK